MRRDNGMSTVEGRVITIVCEHLGVERGQVSRSTRLVEDAGADSLDLVELAVELEDEFGVSVPDDEAVKLKTVGDAVDFIEKELAPR